MKSFLAAALLFASTAALAADPVKVECPLPGVPCKVLFITDNDLTMLMGERGVLSTAAQARNLDLGAYVTYFAQQLRDASLGEVKPKLEAPKTESRVNTDNGPAPAPLTDKK